MKTRLVLVALDWKRSKDPSLSLGHASLLARLSTDASIEVTPLSFAVNAPGFSKEEALSAILAAVGGQGDAFIAIGAFIWNESTVQWLLPELRRSGFRGEIILGGPQVSYAPPGVDALYPHADFFIRGYAEHALAELVGSRGARLPSGVSARDADFNGESAKRDLTSLPSPLLTRVVHPGSFMRWETQRGCPYICSFCQHRESGSRMQFRHFSDNRLRLEMELIVASKVLEIAVLDPVFNMGRASIQHLELLAHLGYSGRIALQCRLELLTEPFLKACRELDVVLEFGLQTMNKEELRAIKRGGKRIKIDEAIGLLHHHRVPFEVSLIYGLPLQTPASFQASIEWCRERGVEVVRAFPLMLLRGTQLNQERERWKLVENDDPIPVVVQSSTFTRSDWEQMHDMATQLNRAATPRLSGLERI